MKTGIKIINAKHIEKYMIEITFNDGKVNRVDFEKQIMLQEVPEYKLYQNLQYFKKFRIENGNIVWGKDWDLVFPLFKLYKNTLDNNAGRKKLDDGNKKVTVRLYIQQSDIDAHGGLLQVQEKLTEYLTKKG